MASKHVKYFHTSFGSSSVLGFRIHDFLCKISLCSCHLRGMDSISEVVINAGDCGGSGGGKHEFSASPPSFFFLLSSQLRLRSNQIWDVVGDVATREEQPTLSRTA